MPRFFVPPENIRDGHFFLTGSEAHHALDVLRKKPGDLLDLFDGKDASYEGRIEATTSDSLSGVIVASQKDLSNRFEVTLYQALIKGPKWDWLVEKACEIGVARLVPVLTARTVVQPKEGVGEKVARWERIALAASKQSGRSKVMEVASPVHFSQAVADLPKGGCVLIPWEKESVVSIRQALRERMGSVAIFIGPEGGWESGEVELARKAGCTPVRLGATLLRSETAGMVAAALVMNELEEGRNP